MRHTTMMISGLLSTALLGASVWLSGCDRNDHRDKGHDEAAGAGSGGESQGASAQGAGMPDEASATGAGHVVKPPPVEPIMALDIYHQVEPARSTSDAKLEPMWTLTPAPPVANQGGDSRGGTTGEDEASSGSTAENQDEKNDDGDDERAHGGENGGHAATADNAPQDATPDGAAPTGTIAWHGPAVLIGRKQLFVDGKVIAEVRCVGREGASCDEGALRASTGKHLLDFGADALVTAEDGASAHVLALRGPAAAWKDKDVAVIADRRVAWGAVEQVVATLRAAGAKPRVAVASFIGGLVDVWPEGVAAPVAPVAAGGECGTPTADDNLPDDVASVLLRVGRGGVGLELQRQSGEVAPREVLGNVLETLSAWAGRIHGAFPAIDTITLVIDPETPAEEVVRALDGVRDDCGQRAKGTPCHDRRRLFTHVVLRLEAAAQPAPASAGDAGAAEAPGKPGGGLDLRLGDPQGGALRLDQRPRAMGGMHLGSPAGRLRLDRGSPNLPRP